MAEVKPVKAWPRFMVVNAKTGEPSIGAWKTAAAASCYSSRGYPVRRVEIRVIEPKRRAKKGRK